MRRSGTESAMHACDGETESGMFEVDVEESKGGTGGRGRCGCCGCRGWAVNSGLAPSVVDRSGGLALRGRNQSGDGIVGIGKPLRTI